MAKRRPPSPPPADAPDAPPATINSTPVDVLLEDLHEHPRNARRGDVEAIKASIRANGFYGFLVVQRSTGFVLAGNHRLRALRELGHTHAPVVSVDVPDDVARRILVADNRTGELGGYDVPGLAALLSEMGPGEALEGTGYDERALGRLLRKLPKPEVAVPAAADDEVSDDPGVLRERWKTEPGQLWLVPSLTRPGAVHRVLCGDTMDDACVARLLEGQPVDLVVMDPPYAIYGSSSGIATDITDDRIVRPFFQAMFRQVRRSLREFGHAYVSCDWRSWPAIWEAAKVEAVTAKNCLVWDKGGAGLGSNYANTYENVGFFAVLPRQTAMGNREAGQRAVFESNVLRYPRPTGEDRMHNAAKPVAMLAFFVVNSSEAGERVLDLFLGSGSTLVAAEQTARVGLGMEVDPRNLAVTLERLSRLGLSPQLAQDVAEDVAG